MKQVEQDALAVEQAAKNADAEELHRLYQKTVGTLRDTSKLLDMLVEHYSNKTAQPRHESDSAISAMQAVALAAIDLAKAVGIKKTSSEQSKGE